MALGARVVAFRLAGNSQAPPDGAAAKTQQLPFVT